MRLLVQIPLGALALFAAGSLWVLAKDVSLGPPLPNSPEGAVLAAPNLDLGDTELVGRLVGDDGAPLAEASLSATLRGRPLWTTTDARGEFRLGGIDRGDISVSILARGYLPVTRVVRAGGTPVEIQLVERNMTLPVFEDSKGADLLGVVDSLLGRRDLSGYEVYLEPVAAPDTMGGPVPRRVTLAEDGGFTVKRLLRGEYYMRVLPPYAAGGSWPNLLRALNEAPLTHFHKGTPSGIRLTMRAGELAGTALERAAIGVEALPLSSALIHVEPSMAASGDTRDPRVFPSVSSDSKGLWRVLDLPAGRYRVFLASGSEGRDVTVTIPEGTSVDPGL